MTNSASICASALRSTTLALLTIFPLSGATAQEVSNAAATTAEAGATATTARVRLFGQNGVSLNFYQNSSCIGGKRATTWATGTRDAFASFLGSVKNTSIGMTESPTTSNLAKRNGTFSKAYFREYEIPANEPLTVDMSSGTSSGPHGSSYCPRFGGTFTPEPGKEYEVTLEFLPGQCVGVVREIQKNEQGPATLRDVDVVPTQKCA